MGKSIQNETFENLYDVYYDDYGDPVLVMRAPIKTVATLLNLQRDATNRIFKECIESEKQCEIYAKNNYYSAEIDTFTIEAAIEPLI